MNEDVNDPFFREFSHSSYLKSDIESLRPPNNSNIVSRIRNFNNSAMNTIGSLFSDSASGSPVSDSFSEGYYEDGVEDTRNGYYGGWQSSSDGIPQSRINSVSQLYPQAHMQNPISQNFSEHSTPTPTRPATPQNPFSEVKRFFNIIRQNSYGRSQESIASEIPLSDMSRPDPSSIGHHQPQSLIASSSASSGSDMDETPPLTPESLRGLALSTSSSPSVDDCRAVGAPTRQDLEDSDTDDHLYTRPHSQEIKQGKQPERPISYDSLMDDLTGVDTIPEELPSETLQDSALADDNSEWYGLEYTLELSNRERRASETSSFASAGEHSKSRESWAAIHQGTIHPYYEDEEFYHWKNWHRYLDRQDEKRRHRKGFEFKARCKDLAWFYADEMRTMDVFYWQLEEYGYVGEDVKARLALIAEHRPDSYYPRKKHDLGWHLKRSRSAACLRELRPLPAP